MRRFLLTSFFSLFLLYASAAPSITYLLSMPQPQTHYFEVEMQLSDIAHTTDALKNGFIDLKMPVWTPGSYLIREYAKNVEGFQAFANNQLVKSEKIRKNAWRIYTTQNNFSVKYRVYAYELSVRTSFLDDSHGYVNGATMFLFHDQLKAVPLRVKIQPYQDWHQISTGLKKIDTHTFEAANYDNLVDCPIEIGNQRIFHFKASGIPHTVAMYGDVKYDEATLSNEMQRVCEAAATVIGEHPCQDYTFIVHNVLVGSGGLEHANSTTLGVNKFSYQTESGHKSFLSLVAHEYFHLWNVKRIRPIALGPFDYENENYTRALWVAEGFTTFYQYNILLRAGLVSADDYWRRMSVLITGIENRPGSRVQSVTDASWDAWIKHYRPNENSPNSTISYYDKGAVIGEMLNLLILAKTNGQKSLDDAMRYLYQEYYKKQQRGFSDDEMQQACEKAAGIDLSDFFQKYIYGTEIIPYQQFLQPFGLDIIDTNANKSQAYLGATATLRGDKMIVTEVVRNSPAYNNGLNVNDEIISINDQRINTTLENALSIQKMGDVLTIIVNRSGSLKTLSVTLGQSPLVNFQIKRVTNPTNSQTRLYRTAIFEK